MPTLILSPRFTNDSVLMRGGAAVRAGWRVLRLSGWRIPPDTVAGPAAIYGEVLFAEAVAGQLGLALLDVPEAWLPGLPPRFLRRELRVATLAAARAHPGPVFVKPADGRKGFAGQLYRAGAGLPSDDACPDDTPVYMAEPVTWQVEVRCFVLHGRVLTCSPYLREGSYTDGDWSLTVEERSAAKACVEQLLAVAPAPSAVVIDIGLIEGRGWAVVEANSAFGAGVYGCDPERVLEVLARACVPRHELGTSDATWALPPVRLE
ncbi:ATP-grasp domain-containing protein [Nocardia salmonicida]|uniref:ATP-grasp domain-containing protein n=1 Tax=Nocardia salmonicida TaxID=53431 RepID=UPI0010425B3B|nr:ATP-grasp domain-containing protein [Nocardia salmonicida]